MPDEIVKCFQTFADSCPVTGEQKSINFVFVPSKFGNKKYLLQDDFACKYGVFVINGTMRQYRVNLKGQEVVIELEIKGWGVNGSKRGKIGTSSRYFIEAWVGNHSLLVSKDQTFKLSEQISLVDEWATKGKSFYFFSLKSAWCN